MEKNSEEILKNYLCLKAAPIQARSWLFGWTQLSEITYDFYQFSVTVKEWGNK